jgi:hypothetical protein
MPAIETYGEISRVIITHDGKSKTLSEWAKYFNLPYATVRMRYTRGKRTFKELFSEFDLHPATIALRGQKAIKRRPTLAEELFSPAVVLMLREQAAARDMSVMQLVIQVVSEWAHAEKLSGVNKSEEDDL